MDKIDIKANLGCDNYEFILSEFRVNVDAVNAWDWFMFTGQHEDGELYRLISITETYNYNHPIIEITVEQWGKYQSIIKILSFVDQCPLVRVIQFLPLTEPLDPMQANLSIDRLKTLGLMATDV